MARDIFLLLLLNFVGYSLTFSFKDIGKSIHIAESLREKDTTSRTLNYVMKEKNVVEKNIPHFVQDALNDVKSSRYRRAVENGLKPNSSSFPFNDSHSQMVIHWAGQNSDVILALTKGSVIGRPFSAVHTSNVFVSHNYGRTFTSLNDKLKLFDGTQAIISQFFNAPALNSHYLFTDETNKYVFTTRDYGKTISRQRVYFKPTKMLFHKTNFSLLLGWDDSETRNGDLYMSSNFGETWHTIQSSVKAVFWEDDKYGLNSSCIYVLRESNNEGLGTIIRSCDFFTLDEIELLTAVHDFEIQGPYMFATRKLRLLGGTGYTHQIYVSYYRGRFINSMFPHDLSHLDYYVADASEDQIFMCVNHDEKTTHLYISNVNGTKFSQSLEDVLYFNPNGSNKNSWLRFYMDKPFADLHKVAGMRGVYIATQLINKTLSSTHQRSLISYDKGGEWQRIVAPPKDINNRPTNCSVNNNCSLHVTQTFNRLYAASRATPILSKESAPGIILATGNYGSRIHIDEDVSVFLSTDAGIGWHQVLQGVHFFALADHGGIILAVKQYEPTNQISYSTDEGQVFHTYNFTDHPIQIHGLLTEPGEKTTVFFLFGSNLDHHSWIVISLNLSSVFQYKCSAQDYKMWSLPDNTPFKGCLLGRKVMIERRVPHSNCYNGKDYNREMTVRNCSCTREDFECDFGYKPNSEYFSVGCIPDPDVDQNIIHRMPSVCPEGTFYPYTRGFAKVSGDTCQGGEEHRYAPLMYACRAQDIEEFLLYSSRREVLQKILSSSQNDVKLLDSTIAKNVSAVDYQLGETGCLYWADNELHKIQRLCEDGNHSVEMLHSGIGEVPSIAYDWKGHNLYWIDRKFPTIEVSKANGIYRRTLINGSYLIKPTSLVIDPHHGWMYWADSGKIMKAYMDGTHSSIATFLSHSTIGSDTVLALDILTERIFWSGAGIRYASLRNPVVTSVGNSLGWFHIDALGIYKEKVYWAEYTMSRLYSCDISNCQYRFQDMNGGIIDLKILDENSQRGGNAACDHNGGCIHLCLLKPSTADVHGKNRTCRCPNNTTLHRTSTTQEDEDCCAVVNVTSGACVKVKTNCTYNQFSCDNGHCIPNSYMCDRDNDCGDMSDEHDCEFQTCSDGHFTCDNGRCIPEDWKCDFDNDCTDNSDEKHCSYPSCPVDKFKCSDGRCINLSWKCDFDDDCPDGLDEENCNYNSTDCGEGQFKCLSGSPRCVPDYQVCDHRNNCADGSDEKNNCSIMCPSWKSSCGDGSCVYLSWVCDGDTDCSNGNDEANCTSTVSPVTALPTTSGPCTGFVCDNGICIRNGLRCDGIDDCGDNSDEYRCGTVRPHTCLNNEFHCRNGRCVAHWMRCDSHNDCGDNTDEYNCNFTTSRPIIECAPGQILCYNSSRRCLDESVICDNFRDCEGGEDEQFCGGVSCDRSLFFKCHSSAACIPKKFLCDEAFNCPDGSDEAACGNQTSGRVRSNITCKAHEFQCMYENKCIPFLFVCDGKPQCAHKSDENLPQCFDSTLADYEINAKMGANNATVEWGPVGVGKNVNYILSYLAYFHQANNWHNTTTLTEPRYTLTKLHSAMTYYITVYATVGSSIHRYKIIQVTTLDDVPDVPRYIGVSSKTSSQTIEVYWGDPQVFKGEILYFEVCIGKTNMTINYCVQSKKNMYTFDSLENEQPFVNGQKYFVQVSAVDSVGEGAKTEPKNITFGIEGISSYVGDLEGTPVGNTSIKLTWGAPANDGEKIDNYVVNYQNLLGNMVTRIVDKKTLSYVIEDLCPGSWYTFSVAPNNKVSGTGPGIYISSKTDGSAIGKISNISVEWIAPAVLKVSWPIPDGASPNENYTVYYDYDPDNLHSHKVSQYAKKRIVNTNSTIIDGLRGCELYYFRIAPGNCILSEVKSETTYYDQLAEPEDLAFHPINMSSGNLTWKASCPNGEPTGYIVYRTEVATGKKVVIQPYSNTSKVELFLTYTKLTPGATYKVTIRNTNKAIDGVDPKMSEPVVFNMDPYPSPFNLHVKSASEIGDSGVLVWVKPSDVPKEIFKGYEVLLCSDIHNEYIKNDGKCKNNTDYKHYAYSKNNTASYSGLTVGYHYFKVRLNKIDGYYGNMSENFTVTVLGGVEVVTQASSLQLSQTNMIAISVSVGVVIMALVVIIGCFVVRHRRLQRSFHAYARSHYDSSSGTTTFSAADELEDEDSPMIRGFSDDEPLVIA